MVAVRAAKGDQQATQQAAQSRSRGFGRRCKKMPSTPSVTGVFDGQEARLSPRLVSNAALAFDAFLVFAGSCVNANDVAFADENGRLKLASGLDRDRFANVG